MQVPTVAVINPPADFTLLRAASTSLASKPVRAIAPPNAIALMTSPMVVSMLLIPPLDNSVSKASLPVTELYPRNIALNKPLKIAAASDSLGSLARVITASHWKTAAKTQPTTVPQISVDRAGNFFIAIMSKITRGKSMNGFIVKDSLIAFCKFTMSSITTLELFPSPIKKNTLSVMTMAGTVVQSMCWIWSNRSLLVTAAARFVVSDNGDNLSPK